MPLNEADTCRTYDDWEERLVNEAPARAIAKSIADAVSALFATDSALLTRNVNERTITGQLAAHIRPRFEGWDVDCEYNRDGHFVKKADGVIVVPDIIIHRRETVRQSTGDRGKEVEFESADEEDLQKLAAFRESHLRYRHSLFLKFIVGPRAPGVARLQWI
jgi:hypothetical protein